MSEAFFEPITTTEAKDATVQPLALDPRLISAAAVLVQWLLETANDPAENAEVLAVDRGA